MAAMSLRPRTEGWIMLAPALAVYLMFAVYPMFDVVVMSFSPALLLAGFLILWGLLDAVSTAHPLA